MRTNQSRKACQLSLGFRDQRPARRTASRQRVSRREIKQTIAQLLLMLEDEPLRKAS